MSMRLLNGGDKATYCGYAAESMPVSTTPRPAFLAEET